MRALIWISTAAVLLWSAYWFTGSWGLDRGIAAGIDSARKDGWTIATETIDVSGYPNRFDVSVTAPQLADPQGRFGWQAPFVKIFALSYRPNRLIAVFPPEQRLTGPWGALDLRADDLRASINLGASTALPLERSVLDGTTLHLLRGTQTLVSVADLGFATQRTGADGLAQRIGLDLGSIAPDPALMARIDPQSRLPSVIEGLRIDATATLDRALDRTLAAGPAPRVTALTLADLTLRWGSVNVAAKGALTVGADGIPEGRIDIRVDDWQRLLDLATDLGLLRAETRPTVERVLDTLRAASGEASTLSVPLVIAGGRASLGPMPLGPVPPLPGYARP